MLNWWLILLIVVIPILCIALSVYVLFYFQSPDDRTSDYVPKAVFCLGLVIAFGSVLLVPFDLANSPDPTVQRKYNQTLDTQLMWQIVLWMMAVMAVVICPFFMFFYEAWDPEKPRIHKQVIHGLIMTVVIFIVFALITGICFWQVGETLVPFQGYTADPQFLSITSTVIAYNGTYTSSKFIINVSFVTYVMGMLCFFGWILFCVYGGAGVAYFPISSFKRFSKRTKAISASRFAEEMALVLAKADALLELSLELQQRTRGTMPQAAKIKIDILRNEVYFLEARQSQLIWAFTKAGGSPFIVFGKLALAFICLGTGVGWILHMFIYNTFDEDPFLNTLLIRLNNAFALCGICAYAVLAFYWMWCTFQGQLGLGFRLVFFQIHPMKHHDTLVNAFLFNVSLLLITAFAVLQFVSRSFQDYAPLTAINGMMTVYIMNLRGIGAFIKWAQFVLLGFTLLTAIFVLICPNKKRRDPTKIRLS